MKLEPNTTRRKNLVTLRAFVAAQKDGVRVSWVELETLTGVEMRTQLSRGLFRIACQRERRGYLPLPGGGVEFSSAANAIELIERHNKRIFGAVKSALTKTAYVIDRHLAQLSGEDARLLVRASSMSSTINMVARARKDPSRLPG